VHDCPKGRLFLRGVEDGLHLVLAGDICGDEAPAATEIGGDLCPGGTIEIGDRNVRSSRRQSARCGTAEPRGPTGNDGGDSVDVHVLSLLLD
jgi:hypothetical protein